VDTAVDTEIIVQAIQEDMIVVDMVAGLVIKLN
jgi:hypothetical protein